MAIALAVLLSLVGGGVIPAQVVASHTSAYNGIQARRHKLLVISVDGFDWRYLRDRDKDNERIPNLRKLMAAGQVADGVTGVWPTITWPSHTTLITGVPPDVHGILGNRRPRAEGGEYYWTADLIKVPTLLTCAAQQHLTTASVTWPVTVGASLTYNLPEYFQRRNGGSMDMESVTSKAVPADLVQQISRDAPSFPQQWMDDRTRTIAAVWLLRHRQPDVLLVHLVDLDSDQHDAGPFNVPSRATLERTDALIGEMMQALPEDYDIAITADHGFERVDHTANLNVLLQQHGITGKVRSLGGLAVTDDGAVAAFLREESAAANDGIGRIVPPDELARYAPSLKGVMLAVAPQEHFMFGMGGAPPPSTAGTQDRPEAAETEPQYLAPPYEKGNHGFWPVRDDYSSVFILAGPGVHAEHIGRIEMTSIKDRFAKVLGLTCP